jgi:hypothetical protein
MSRLNRCVIKEVSCELVVIRRTLQDSKRRRKPVEVL